jgi:polar amino acid transport system permease protein
MYLGENGMGYIWRWNVIWDNWYIFVQGAAVTLSITAVSLGIGLIFGLILAFGRISKIKFAYFISTAIVEIFRDTPLLVQLFWVFYCLPIILNVKIDIIPSAIIGLSIQASAYLSEVYRAGIQSIDKGQMEAALSVGMSYWQGMRNIILPQALRRMVPPFLNVAADFMKASSLVSVVGVFELLRQANNLISNSWRPLEIYTTVGIVYFIIIYPIVWITGQLEVRMSERYATR